MISSDDVRWPKAMARLRKMKGITEPIRSRRLISFDHVLFRWESLPPPKNYAALIPMSPVIMTQEQYLDMQWTALDGYRHSRYPYPYSWLIRGAIVIKPEDTWRKQ